MISDLRKVNVFLIRIHELMVVVQYIIATLLISIVIQILFFSKFFTITIILSTVLSYVPASITLGYLSYKFLSWYRTSDKKEIPVLMYSLASILVCTAITVNTVVYNAMILQYPDAITPITQVLFQEISFASLGILGILYIVGFVPFIFGFTLSWAGTAKLLRSNLGNIRSIKYWLLISLPLFFYLIAILPTLKALPEARFIFDDPNLIYFRMIFKPAVVAGGLLFCMVFIVIARNSQKLLDEGKNQSRLIKIGD